MMGEGPVLAFRAKGMASISLEGILICRKVFVLFSCRRVVSCIYVSEITKLMSNMLM